MPLLKSPESRAWGRGLLCSYFIRKRDPGTRCTGAKLSRLGCVPRVGIAGSWVYAFLGYKKVQLHPFKNWVSSLIIDRSGSLGVEEIILWTYKHLSAQKSPTVNETCVAKCFPNQMDHKSFCSLDPLIGLAWERLV